MNLPPLRAVQYFEVVARLQSFSKAALELHVTQSAVSHQVRLLEEHLDVTLFERQGRMFSLSNVGEGFYEEISTALGAISNASRTIKSGRKGKVRLAVYSSLAVKWLIPRLESFKQQYPHIELTLNMVADDVTFNEHIADCFISVIPPKKGYISKSLYQECLVPACGKSLWQQIKHLSLNDIINQQLLLSTQYFDVGENQHTDWLRWCASAGIPLASDAKFSHFSHVLFTAEAAKFNLGIMLIDTMLMESISSTDNLIQIDKHELVTGDSYYFVYKENQAKNTDIQALEHWLLAQCVI